VKTYAFYLPQFHTCPENDHFWGEGFTDWTTTRAARPLFPGHAQPIAPGELGYYDLTDAEVIRAQARLARGAGIDGFAIYHYWFDADVRALDEPIRLLRADPTIDIEYFVSWVNEDWTKSWVGDDATLIFEQKYGRRNHELFFEEVMGFFDDRRYARVDDRPILYVQRPGHFDCERFMRLGDAVSRARGHGPIYWVAPEIHVPRSLRGRFDAVLGYPPGDLNPHSGSDDDLRTILSPKALLERYLPDVVFRKPGVFRALRCHSYERYCQDYARHVRGRLAACPNYVPCLMPNWDNTPRYGERGFLFEGASPRSFAAMVEDALAAASDTTPFLLLKAWNEWAEGNHLEPDAATGRARLDALQEVLERAPGGNHASSAEPSHRTEETRP
jgi:hypothetical protein